MRSEGKGRRQLAWLFLVFGLAACGGGSGGGGGPTGPVPAASISVSAAPAAWTAGPCPPEHCGPLVGELEVTGSLTVSESAGVGGTLGTISIDVRDAAGASISTPTFDPAAFGGTRVPAFGMATLSGIGIHFPPDHPAASLAVTVPMRDDHGNTVSASTTVEVR